jgi:precorrin-3B C17-methyltransferase
LKIVGIGPGDRASLSQRAVMALSWCEVVVGYRAYIDLLKDLIKGKEVVVSGMRQEIERAREAIRRALEGKRVCVISSGDSGIYGMAGLILDLLTEEEERQIGVEIIPGITAASSCAALLGAPLMNDFAVISLSDLLTDQRVIEQRIRTACEGDFVIVFYNPKSRKRVEPLRKAWQILMSQRPPQTPVGIVRNAQRRGEEVILASLKDLLAVKQIDMGTTIIVGNSKTRMKGNYMITPRGYRL